MFKIISIYLWKCMTLFTNGDYTLTIYFDNDEVRVYDMRKVQETVNFGC